MYAPNGVHAAAWMLVPRQGVGPFRFTDRSSTALSDKASFPNPTFMTRRRRASASRWQPTGTWGRVTLSERPTPRKRGEPLTRLQAAEERLNGHVRADRDVLQHLRVHPGQRGPFRLERWQQRVLVVEPHGLLALFPRRLAFFEQAIIEPSARVN